jgi:hypothetical protein
VSDNRPVYRSVISRRCILTDVFNLMNTLGIECFDVVSHDIGCRFP